MDVMLACVARQQDCSSHTLACILPIVIGSACVSGLLQECLDIETEAVGHARSAPRHPQQSLSDYTGDRHTAQKTGKHSLRKGMKEA